MVVWRSSLLLGAGCIAIVWDKGGEVGGWIVLCCRHCWIRDVFGVLVCLLLKAHRGYFGFDIEVCSLEAFRKPTARLGVKVLQIAGSLREIELLWRFSEP